MEAVFDVVFYHLCRIVESAIISTQVGSLCYGDALDQ